MESAKLMMVMTALARYYPSSHERIGSIFRRAERKASDHGYHN